MPASTIIKKTHKDPGGSLEFSEIKSLTGEIYTAVAGGKRWILKGLKDPGMASAVMLRREYEISSSLQHPYILSPLMFSEHTPAGPAIVMEYVEGRTLKAFIGQKPDMTVRRKVLSEILEAVDYLHMRGLLHNDLKPENILVTNIGDHVRIIDFGLAENEADYLNRRLGGTAGASAPEVMSGDTTSVSDASSDIWSIGGIISGMFPRRYGNIVRKCRKPRPDDRYRSICELKRALDHADRCPVAVAMAAVMLCLVGMAFVPYVIRQERAVVMSENKVVPDSICADLEAMCKSAVDSISNPAIAPFREYALPIMTNWADRFAGYKQSHAEWGSEIDSVYIEHYSEILEAVNSLPFSK